ncbi:MAG: MlaC/ttg2D family ABC transporter substrate-binding protein [Gammaproteobacteria bacterium]
MFRLSRLIVWAIIGLLMPLSPAVQAGPAEEAQAVVKTVTDDVLAKLKSLDKASREDTKHVFALVNEVVVPHFDSVTMASWVLGKHWRSASKDQKLDFTREFRTLLVRTYGTALARYTDEKVVYDTPRADDKGERVKVPTRIVQTGGGPDIPISYSLRNRDGEWKVYDVVIDGISMVTNYRSTYSQRIGQSGIDGLIQQLVAHNGA